MASRIGVEPKAIGKNPFTVICYVCGREYGSKSISIHERDCLEKCNKALPKSMRKPPPLRPTIKGAENPFDDVAVGTKDQAPSQAYNDAAYDSFQNQSLFPCETCGRKFVPTALEHHKNACRPGGLFDKVKAKVETPQKSQSAPKPKLQGPPDLIPCRICNRTFLPVALEHHSKVCKEGGYFQKHSRDFKDTHGTTPTKTASASACSKCKCKVVTSAKYCSNCGTKNC